MKQVFYNGSCEPDQAISLDDKVAHHIFDVLRTAGKEQIRIAADNGVFFGHVLEKPMVKIKEKAEEARVSAAPITVCAAMVKADKFEWMIQKAVELGADEIVPLETERTIIRIDPAKFEKKRARWQSIADQAARQSNRPKTAKILPVCRLKDIEQHKSGCNICAYEKEAQSHHLCSALQGYDGSLTFVIGPEGGLSEEEADFLEQSGFALCSLGNNILRAETAVCYLLSCAEFSRAQAAMDAEGMNHEDV